jgi:hypothetical protein
MKSEVCVKQEPGTQAGSTVIQQETPTAPNVLLGPVKIFKHIFEKAGVENLKKLEKLPNWKLDCISPDGFLRLVDYRKQPDLIAQFDQTRSDHPIISCARNNLTLA